MTVLIIRIIVGVASVALAYHLFHEIREWNSGFNKNKESN